MLGEKRALALLFKKLATLRTDAALFADVEELRWTGPNATLEGLIARMGDTRLAARIAKLAARRA